MIAPFNILLADSAYDANRFRLWLDDQGVVAVVPSTTSRRAPIPYDTTRYEARNMIERLPCRLKDFRRIATRYDKRGHVPVCTMPRGRYLMVDLIESGP